MNWCNNCNVELSSYLKKCPLCNKKVKSKNNVSNPYGNYIENFSSRVNMLYFSKLIIKILLLITFITMITNLILNKRISWSLYVVSSVIYTLSFYLYLILDNKKVAFIINNIFLELLLFVISLLTKTTSWFIYLVGPIIIIVVLFILLNIYLSRFKNILRNFSCLLLYIALSLNILDILINYYNKGIIKMKWSIYSNIPIVLICLFMYILSHNKKIVNEVEKRFFI